jgi:hypothetical protein
MKKHKLKILFGCAGLFLFTACGEYDKEKGLYYHKAMGEGYVFYEETKEPAPFARIKVEAGFPYSGPYTGIPIQEEYTADENGYYKVKFIKRKKMIGKSAKSACSAVYAYSKEPIGVVSLSAKSAVFGKDFLEKQKTIFKIDTLWLR